MESLTVAFLVDVNHCQILTLGIKLITANKESVDSLKCSYRSNWSARLDRLVWNVILFGQTNVFVPQS